jgi:hypothetical protein
VSESSNTSGQAYSLTVLTPIVAEGESRLVHTLDMLAPGAGSPLAQVPGTHFARWVVISDVVYEGTPQRRDHLDLGRLLFTSNFDGELGPYLEHLRVGLGTHADTIWSHCVGYPGSADADADAFASYLRAHQVKSSLFFAAYGDRTVEQVKSGLAARRDLTEFAMTAQGMSATELQTAFRGKFGQ